MYLNFIANKAVREDLDCVLYIFEVICHIVKKVKMEREKGGKDR